MCLTNSNRLLVFVVISGQILDLEQELKKQAGEDKKFYPNQHSVLVPQIDGLDDTPLEEQLGAVAAGALQQNPELKLHLPVNVPAGDGGGGGGDADENDEKAKVEVAEKTLKEPAGEEEEEIDGDLLEGEDDRKAFMDGVLEALQEHPELLSQMLQGRCIAQCVLDTLGPCHEIESCSLKTKQDYYFCLSFHVNTSFSLIQQMRHVCVFCANPVLNTMSQESRK